MSNLTDEGERTADHEARSAGDEAGGPGRRNDADRFDDRLRAVERALTGSDAAVADLGDEAAAAAEREALESRVDDLESRVEELEAATQAVRGYVGSIRAVNREVERRADLALARASRAGDEAFDDAAERRDADGEEGGDAAGSGSRNRGRGGAVPSESALDAAVPTEDDPRTPAPAAVDTEGAGAHEAEGTGARDDAKGSWRNEALDRLRESL